MNTNHPQACWRMLLPQQLESESDLALV